MVMATVFDAALIVSANDCEVLAEALSVTCTVKLEVPTAVGVPVIAPAPELNAKPAGRAPPVIDQLYGVVPPVAASVCE